MSWHERGANAAVARAMLVARNIYVAALPMRATGVAPGCAELGRGGGCVQMMSEGLYKPGARAPHSHEIVVVVVRVRDFAAGATKTESIVDITCMAKIKWLSFPNT